MGDKFLAREVSMTLLGIDPGFKVTGFGIMRKGQTTALIDHGCLMLPSTKSLVERIGIFHRFFTEKITAHTVTHIALETPFLGKNSQTFLKLGYLRGCVYLLADTYQLTLHEYTPSQVKLALTGHGSAPKEQVARVIHTLFPTLQKTATLDATDAIAIALCGLWQTRMSIHGKTRYQSIG